MNIEAPIETLIQTGINAARVGDFDTARHHLTEATQLNPKAAEAWFWLGLLLDDPKEQLEHMQRVLRLDPTHTHAQEAMLQLIGAASRTRQTRAAEPTNGKASKQVGHATLWRVDNKPAPAKTKPPNLLQAWRAALTFNGEGAYTAYRGRSSAPLTAIFLIVVVTLMPFADIMLPLLPASSRLDVNDSARFVGEALAYSLCIALQVVTALFVGAWLAAYVGRKRFGSDVTATANFGLNGLWMVPGGAGLLALGVGLWLLGDMARISAPFTLFVYGVYLLAQLIYSNTVIHRVGVGAGGAIAAVSLLSAGLMLAWLLPFTAVPG